MDWISLRMSGSRGVLGEKRVWMSVSAMVGRVSDLLRRMVMYCSSSIDRTVVGIAPKPAGRLS